MKSTCEILTAERARSMLQYCCLRLKQDTGHVSHAVYEPVLHAFSHATQPELHLPCHSSMNLHHDRWLDWLSKVFPLNFDHVVMVLPCTAVRIVPRAVCVVLASHAAGCAFTAFSKIPSNFATWC